MSVDLSALHCTERGSKQALFRLYFRKPGPSEACNHRYFHNIISVSVIFWAGPGQSTGCGLTEIRSVPWCTGMLSSAASQEQPSGQPSSRTLYACNGQCGDPDCSLAYAQVWRLRRHLLEDTMESHAFEQDASDASSDSEPGGATGADHASARGFDPMLDAAAQLYAYLDSSEHLQQAVIVRIFEATQAYVTAAVGCCLDSAGLSPSQTTVATTALDSLLSAALRMARNHPERPASQLRTRLTRLGFREPTAVHERTEPVSGGKVYEVCLVQDILQNLQDAAVAADVAAADRRWRTLAQQASGSPAIISEIEDGALFHERVLPVVKSLPPDALLMVGLPYMDDVDVCNSRGPSAGVHQQNMQYVTWLNVTRNARTALHNIRLTACCPTSLTHSSAGFAYVISDLGDSDNVGYSLGAQARRLQPGGPGAPFDLSGKVEALSHIRRLYVMFLFVEGDNKGLNEAFGFVASFHPSVFSLCRQCLDIRESAPVAANEGPITAKWRARQNCRGDVGKCGQVDRFMRKGLEGLRTPELFKELQHDVAALCQSDRGQEVARLIQLLGAANQLNLDGTVRPHGYSGVPGLVEHWDLTAPPEAMHDWLLGWTQQAGGAFVGLCALRKWASVAEVEEATDRYYANSGVRRPKTRLKAARFTTTWYDPCKDCKTDHVHTRKRLVLPGETKLPWNAADNLHWMLHSLGIYLLIPRVRRELCKAYAEMDAAVYAYVLHVEVLGRLCARRFVCSELPHLESAVGLALAKYKAVPEYVLLIGKAKLHGCTHTVLFILLCGPLRDWWCMRLEGKHQPLKALATRCNFLNVSCSVAHGAMRALAYWYSTNRFGSGGVRFLGDKLGHSLGLTSSPVISPEGLQLALADSPFLDPQVGAYYVTHWSRASCRSGGEYRRLDTVAMLHRGSAAGGGMRVYACLVLGALESHGALPGLPSCATVVVHALPQQISVGAHGEWSLNGTEAEIRAQLSSLAGQTVLLSLPLSTHHPDIELVPVVLCASPQRPLSGCTVVPRHSGFA